jgi:hypothetical protein
VRLANAGQNDEEKNRSSLFRFSFNQLLEGFDGDGEAKRGYRLIAGRKTRLEEMLSPTLAKAGPFRALLIITV